MQEKRSQAGSFRIYLTAKRGQKQGSVREAEARRGFNIDLRSVPTAGMVALTFKNGADYICTICPFTPQSGSGTPVQSGTK